MANTTRLLVLYHSSYGHVETLAYAVAHGARAVDGVHVSVKRVPELMPEDVIRSATMKVDQPAPIADPADAKLPRSDRASLGRGRADRQSRQRLHLLLDRRRQRDHDHIVPLDAVASRHGRGRPALLRAGPRRSQRVERRLPLWRGHDLGTGR